MSRINGKSTMLVVALMPVLAQAADSRYIVQFKEGHAHGRAVVESLGGQVRREITGMNALAAVLPERALQGLRNNPSVELIEEDAKRYMMGQTTPYGIDMVQAPLVWNAGATGNGRKVCIIDSGLYLAHEDHSGTTRSVAGYPAGWNTDKCHHGTHVAGTIAALDNTTGVVGVLPNGVDLHIIKVFGDDCSWAYASDLADAANRCVSAGANIISMSLGGSVKSRTEENAFKSAWNKGVMLVAAAGNGGTNRLSYPASYPVVLSVGAVDSAKTIASFSQYNREVDVVAPGVGVLSTVGIKEDNTLTVNGVTYAGSHIELASHAAGVSGTLVDGGICDTVGAWTGKVVLCQRGTIGFFDKTMNVQSGGGVAAVIYNNVSGDFLGTLGSGNSSAIPAISLSLENGEAIKSNGSVGLSSTVVSQVTVPASGYASYDGTSMATPHVSAVAALIWSYKPTWTNVQVREALEKTAEDLGAARRDDYHGHGLIRAKAALDYLRATYP